MQKNKFAVAVVAAVGAFSSFAANAAVDASVGTALAAVKDDATSLAGVVTPIIIAVLGLGITIKLIKRFANKI